MDPTYQPTTDVHVLPTSLTLPGAGVLTINAYVLLAQQPVLIDTGIGTDGADFIDALTAVVDPADLAWVWLTHDDADHTGNLQRVLDLAPQARLVTHGLGALRHATWSAIPLDRVHAIRVGDTLDVGDRTLTAVRPPLFDNPMSTGIVDGKSGALFSVDAFGALLPAAVQDVADVAEAELVGGMTGWSLFDSPWVHLVDRDRFAEVLAGVRRLGPSHIFSSHLPSAAGTSLDQFLAIVAQLPYAEPAVAPGPEDFAQMLALMAGRPEPAVV